jgi:hypothetical protein
MKVSFEEKLRELKQLIRRRADASVCAVIQLSASSLLASIGIDADTV